jgi:hypothetical protein
MIHGPVIGGPRARMFGHRFHLVFVGATSIALPIGKHEPLMMANFRDDVG